MIYLLNPRPGLPTLYHAAIGGGYQSRPVVFRRHTPIHACGFFELFGFRGALIRRVK